MVEERWFGAALAACDGLGPVRLRELRRRFGSWAAAWRVGPEGWRLQGVRPEQVESWRRLGSQFGPARIRESCRRLGVTLLEESDAGYPRLLGEVSPASPPLLFVRGISSVLTQPAVTVVGTRRPTPYGVDVARALGRLLAEAGLVTVSGLAFGIDAAAHAGALAGGGPCAAVLAAGLERASPRAQRALYRRLLAGGVAVSEYPPRIPPEPGRFPARNRILAALADVTVVVEAPARSGALITARYAAEWGRTVMAVPGPVTSRASRGCHGLIADGAQVIGALEDVLAAVGRDAARRRGGADAAAALCLTETEQVVYSLLDITQPRATEIVIRNSGLEAGVAVAALTGLELKGLCVRRGGSVRAARPERP